MHGRWEGDTLVVETRNIARSEEGSSFSREAARIRAANGGRTESMRVVERFTRVDADTLRYEFTVEDAARWPWSGELPLRPTDKSVFECACHEGNYGIVNMLRGARAQERQVAGDAGRRADDLHAVSGILRSVNDRADRAPRSVQHHGFRTELCAVFVTHFQ